MTIYKEASSIDAFIGGFTKTIKENVDLQEKPFETIFSVLGPAVAFGISPFLGFIATMAELGDFNLGLMGKKVDEYFGFGKGKSPSKVSESQIEGAAKQITDDLYSSSAVQKTLSILGKNEATAMLKDIRQIKGTATKSDVLVALAYAESQNGFIKQSGWLKGLLGFGKRAPVEQRKGIFYYLKWLIKKILVVLGLMGVAGGTVSVFKDAVGLGQDGPGKENQKTDSTLLKNTKGNVMETILHFLNEEFDFNKGTIVSFSQMFKDQYKKPIESSEQMRTLLFKIQLLNGGVSINEISKWNSFFAPSLNSMFKNFFPDLQAPIDNTVEVSNNTKLSKRDQEPEEDVSSMIKKMHGNL